jgi:hypothetical protein
MFIPPAFDPQDYRARYKDIADHDDDFARRHYERHGRNEGRVPSPYALRENFIGLVDTSRPTLEIGPFDNPRMIGDGVEYFDVLDRAGLEKRSAELRRNRRSPDIHHVSPTGDLGIVERKYDAIFSCHCVEHQPDLIGHLRHVERMLADDAAYYIVLPDKRFCFDHFFPASDVDAAVDAYREQRRFHTATNVIRHFAFATHNDARRHWHGDHCDEDYEKNIPARTLAALEKISRERGRYLDVHAWQFTPESFEWLIEALFSLGSIKLRPARVFGTAKYRFEFTAILTRRGVLDAQSAMVRRPALRPLRP